LYANRGATRSRVRNYGLLYFGSEQIARSLHLDDVLLALDGHLHGLLARMSPSSVFVEKSSVLVRRGRATVLVGGEPGPRAEVVARCVHAGASCYSTTRAVFDLIERVFPYMSEIDRSRAQPIDIDGPPVRVDTIVIGDTGVGPDRPLPAVSPGQALVALLSHAPSAPAHPQTVMPMLRGVVSTASLLAAHWENTEDLASDLSARWRLAPTGARKERNHDPAFCT
jgi:hypothetical protein